MSKAIIERTSRRRSIDISDAAPSKPKKMWQSMLVAGAVSAALMGISVANAGSATSIVGPGSLSGLTPTAGSNRAPEAIDKNTGQVITNGRVLLAWTADNIVDDGVANSDFLAVIDAEPNSTTYGKVIWTAGLPKIVGANNPGTALGHTSDVHNDPHHNTAYTSYIDPVTGKKYLFAGGVISGNVFRFDISDVRAIPTAEIAICGTELTLSALTDDFMVLPNGHMAVTYMGGHTYYGPGTVTEFAPKRKGACAGGTPYDQSLPDSVQDQSQYLRENSAIKLNSGVVRYKPQQVTGNTDAGLEAYPHGMQLTADGNYLVTSDYANPAVLGGSDPIQNLFNSSFLNSPLSSDTTSLRQFGTTVRVWSASNLANGVLTVSQVPDGPRVEDIYFHDEPEGMMAFGMPHKTGHVDANGNFVPHQGAFSASMCGGTLYYTSNILAPQSANNGQGPRWKAVYDVGPCTGVSYFQISDDDRYMYLPIAGVQSPGDPVYNRDYPGEHDRRVLALDIRPLLRKGTGTIDCDFPPADPSRPGNTSLGMLNGNPDPLNNRVHNNGVADCPVVTGIVTNNSPMNYASHGGAHFVGTDRIGSVDANLAPGKRLFFVDYFVNLDHMGLQGTGSDGDRKIYMVKINSDGSLSYDTDFRDELTGEVGLAFTGPQRAAYSWPNRGVTGSAKPHAGVFEANNVVLKGAESYDPSSSSNVVTNY